MITSAANPKVKYVRRLQADRRFRQREKAFVIEGTRWLRELVQFYRQPHLVFYTEAWLNMTANQALLAQLDRPSSLVSDALMNDMSDTQTPAGILAVVPMAPQPLPEQPTLLLILDQVADPGNLGTMLRTAAAAGADGLLLSPGCVDVYNPKVVRSSMGALLRLPIRRANWREIGRLTTGLQVRLAAADSPLPYTAVDWRRPSALIIGSESAGAGDQASQLAAEHISIPMHAQTESLNAAMAAGIILFEAARQRLDGKREM